MEIHIRRRCGKSLSGVFPAACQCEQPEISMYHCEVNELFPNLPSLLGGEFSGFKTGKALGRADCTEPFSEASGLWSRLKLSFLATHGTRLFSSHTSLTFPHYPASHTYLPAYSRGIQCVPLILHLTITSRLSLIQTSGNAHLDYCVFYWRNCNGDVQLIFGKHCIYLPVF